MGSVYEITEGAVALTDFQDDSANLALTKDIFGLGAVSENDEGEYITGCLTRNDYFVCL